MASTRSRMAHRPLPLALQSFGISFKHESPDNLAERIRTLLYDDLVYNLSYDPFFGEKEPDFSKTLRHQQRVRSNSEYSENARGRPCGHVFGKGETVYRCRNCGMDDTCVMCQKCYKGSSHEGHDVAMSINGGSGGCCDCGDPEAWRVEMRCKYHFSELPVESIVQPTVPIEIEKNIRSTVSNVLDFILDVMSHAKDSAKPPSLEDDTNPQLDAIRARLKGSNYDPPLEVGLEYSWSTVLWNDEKHNFDEVIDIVKRACKKTTSYGREIANKVDTRGRATVFTGPLKEAVGVAKFLSKIRLGVTVRCARDIFREDLVELLLNFLQDIANLLLHLNNGDINSDFVRTVICQELCRPWQQGVGPDLQTHEEPEEPTPMVDSGDEEEDMDEEVEDDVEDVEMMDVQDVAEVLDVNPVEVRAPLWERIALMPREQRENLLAAHNQARTNAGLPPQTGFPLTNDAGAATLVTNVANPRQEDLEVEFEVDGQVQIVRLPNIWLDGTTQREENSPALLEDQTPSGALSDEVVDDTMKRYNPPHWQTRYGEAPNSDASRLTHLFVQDLRLWKLARAGLRELYITTMVAIPYFKREMGIRFALSYRQLTEAFLFADREPEQSMVLFAVQIFTVPSIALVLVQDYEFLTTLLAVCYTYYSQHKIGSPSEVNTQAHQSSDVYTFKSRRHYHIINDLRYLLCTGAVQKVIPSLFAVQLQFLDWLELFQGQNPQEQAVGRHVEYESMAYAAAFNVILQIAKHTQMLAGTFEHAARGGESDQLKHILHECTTRLSKWALGEHKSYRPKFEPILSGPQQISFHHPLHWLLVGLSRHLRDGDRVDFLPNPSTNFEELMRIAQYPLKVIHMGWQIRCNMWVRNGHSIQTQLYRYTDVDSRESCIDKDIQFVQLLLATPGPSPRVGKRYWSQDLQDACARHIDQHSAILAWVLQTFESVPEATNMSNDTSLIQMQNHLFHFLIILFSERAWLLGISNEENICRALRHGLMFGPKTYSEIVKMVNDDRGDEACFTAVLERLTEYKPPTGMDDVGHFVLKDEEFESIDPYYHHFTLQQIEEANEILTKRSKTGQTAFECKLEPLLSSPWNGISEFVFTPIFQDYITAYFANLRTCARSTPKLVSIREGVTDKILQLLLLITQEEESRRARGEITTTSIFTTLFDSFGQNPMLKAHHGKLRVIYDRLRKLTVYDPSAPSITPRSPTKREHINDVPDSDDAEFARKKALAKARQAKLMSDMRDSQNAFISKNAPETLESLEDDDKSQDEAQGSVWHFPSGNCIICQNAVQVDGETYGVLAGIHESRLDRKCPITEPIVTCIHDILRHPLSMDGTSEWRPTTDFPPNQAIPQSSMTTCGHIMHFTCYDNWYGNIKAQYRNWMLQGREFPSSIEFQCPLCKTIGNAFMPIMSKAQKVSNADDLFANLPLTGSLSSMNCEAFILDTYKVAERITEDMIINRDFVERAETLSAAVRAGKSRFTKDIQSQDQWDEEFVGFYQLRKAIKSHQRARIDENQGESETTPASATLSKFTDHVDILTSSIMDIEVALRDRTHNDNKTSPVATIVDGMSEQNLITVRVQTNIIHGCLALSLYFHAYGPDADEKAGDLNNFAEDIEARMQDRIIQIYHPERWREGLPTRLSGLLVENIFGILVESATIQDRLDIRPLANTLLLAEVVKSVAFYLPILVEKRGLLGSLPLPEFEISSVQNFRHWCHFVLQGLQIVPDLDCLENADIYRALYGLVQRSALVFVRRCAILMKSVCNIGITNDARHVITDELSKLLSILGLTPFENLLRIDTSDASRKLASLAREWVHVLHVVNPQDSHLNIAPSYPLPLTLTNLPHSLDSLFERCQVYVCPKCETTPNAPAICLLCGTIVCFQSQCCWDPIGAGECTTHRMECGGSVGLFLVVKRCALLVMRMEGGAFGPAPYLDIHGELDPDLRRGKPQFLNERRYEVGVRQMYLQHQVGTWLARKSESMADMGGWETL